MISFPLEAVRHLRPGVINQLKRSASRQGKNPIFRTGGADPLPVA